jgi:hypothetical protein
VHADVFEHVRSGGLQHLPDLSRQGDIAWRGDSEMDEVHEAAVLFGSSIPSLLVE